ncbi:MAG: LPS-assembly protein LptD, partial [Alphaproteobacteria bacterium]
MLETMKIIYKSLLLSLSILILGGFFAPLTHAQTNAGLVLEAQIIDYDDVLNIITARDAVFVEYEGRKLYADTLSYNQNTAMISVSGNVRIIEPTGEILTTNYAQLDDNLSEAVIEELLFQIDENARIAANGAIRTQGRYTAMAKAVYSACRACAENPDAPLLWQMKAADIVHDNVDKTIHYYDLSLEVKGVPIFYTPYFSHADPSVKYKTGLLFPTFGTLNSELFYMQPVYWNISAHEDATFTPIYANEQAMLGLEYRKQIKNGSL